MKRNDDAPRVRRRKVPRNQLRDVPYRPRREEYDTAGAFGLVAEFFRRYLRPIRGSLTIYVLVMTLNACSVYLMAYYGKVVVDDILMVNAENTPARQVDGTAARLSNPDTPVGSRDRAGTPPSAARADSLSGRERRADGVVSEGHRRANPPVRGPNAGGRLLALFVIYLGTIFILNRAIRHVVLLRHRISRTLSTRLRDDVHRKVVSLSSVYHKGTSPGRLMSRILSDVDIMRDNIIALLETSVSQTAMFLVGLAILLGISPRSAVVVLLAMVPYSIAMRANTLKMRTINREIRHSNSCLWGLVAQKLDAVKAIFAYGRERAEALNFFRLSAVMQRDSIAQQRLGATVGRSAQLVSTLTTQGIFLYCTTQVLDGSMSLGEMIYVNGAVVNLFTPVVNLTNLSVTISNMLVIMQRISSLMKSQSVIKEDPAPVPIKLPLKHGISMKDVSFSYSDGGPEVLHNINLEIGAASWLCIMGPSGAGKSTLVGLLARLYDATSGEINIDGTPIRKVSFRSLRSDMAVVPQEAQILSGTVRDNITYGHPDASPDEIMAAARAADCHDFIMNLPVKYETIIGEKGTTLSGGQRQRISIARALLTDPKILVLDDCTSALDANTERKIQETLSKLMHDRTSIIVSQRVSMAMRCDSIIVLEDGSVTESGTHDELVNAGGFYSKLYAQQTH